MWVELERLNGRGRRTEKLPSRDETRARFDDKTDWQFSNFERARLFSAPSRKPGTKPSRDSVWPFWRSDRSLYLVTISLFTPLNTAARDLASAHHPSSTRSDEGLESKRGTDVTYCNHRYNLAVNHSEKAVEILIASALVSNQYCSKTSAVVTNILQTALSWR